MIDKMLEVVPIDSHEFRTILPEDFAEMIKKYQNNQYEIKSTEVDPSKK